MWMGWKTLQRCWMFVKHERWTNIARDSPRALWLALEGVNIPEDRRWLELPRLLLTQAISQPVRDLHQAKPRWEVFAEVTTSSKKSLTEISLIPMPVR